MNPGSGRGSTEEQIANQHTGQGSCEVYIVMERAAKFVPTTEMRLPHCIVSQLDLSLEASHLRSPLLTTNIIYAFRTAAGQRHNGNFCFLCIVRNTTTGRLNILRAKCSNSGTSYRFQLLHTVSVLVKQGKYTLVQAFIFFFRTASKSPVLYGIPKWILTALMQT